MILNKIKEALEGTGLTGCYITRRNNPLPCVVYSYTSLPKSNADNVIDTIEYTVLCNILVVEDIDMNLHKYNLIIDTSNSMPLIKNVQLETGDSNEY